MKILKIIILSIVIVILPAGVFAQSMTSTNYTIISSDFKTGGTTSSTNYRLTTGASPLGTTTTSTNYSIFGGLVGSISGSGTLTADLSSSSISFGELSVSEVKSASTIITVTTDSATGYNVQMSESGQFADGSNTINDVSDGTVSAGQEEYGIRTSGAAGQFNATDTSITSSLKTIATSAAPQTNQQTTITFKASIDENTVAGSYSHTVSLATTANF